MATPSERYPLIASVFGLAATGGIALATDMVETRIISVVGVVLGLAAVVVSVIRLRRPPT